MSATINPISSSSSSSALHLGLWIAAYVFIVVLATPCPPKYIYSRCVSRRSWKDREDSAWPGTDKSSHLRGNILFSTAPKTEN